MKRFPPPWKFRVLWQKFVFQLFFFASLYLENYLTFSAFFNVRRLRKTHSSNFLRLPQVKYSSCKSYEGDKKDTFETLIVLYSLKYWQICIFDVTHPNSNPISDKIVLINFSEIRARNVTFWRFCVFPKIDVFGFWAFFEKLYGQSCLYFGHG